MNITVEGIISAGSGKARLLGCPTLNATPQDVHFFEAFVPGVYAAVADFDGQSFASLFYFGPPNLSRFEVHFLNAVRTADGVGKKISVELLEKIRPPKIFSREEDLKNAILGDMEAAKMICLRHGYPVPA